jgi:hypothetical protein
VLPIFRDVTIWELLWELQLTNLILSIIHFISLRRNAFPIWIRLMARKFRERNAYLNISNLQLIVPNVSIAV